MSESTSDPLAGGVDLTSLITAVLCFENEPGYGRVAVAGDGTHVEVLWKGQPPAGLLDLARSAEARGRLTMSPCRFAKAEVDTAMRRILNDQEVRRVVTEVLASKDMSGLRVSLRSDSSLTTIDLERVAGMPVKPGPPLGPLVAL